MWKNNKDIVKIMKNLNFIDDKGTLIVESISKDELHSILCQIVDTESNPEKIKQNKMQFVGEMTSGVIHEINSPLTGVSLLAESLSYLVEDAKENEESFNSLDFFESIENTAQSIIKITKNIGDTVNSLSAFSKNSKIEQVSLANLMQVVDQSSVVCQNMFKKNKVSFTNAIDFKGIDSNQFLQINSSYLSQIISSCLKNSVEAIAKLDERWIKVWGMVGDNSMKLFIQDSGTKPSVEIAQEMYDAFFTTKKENGLGLGLNVVKNILDKYEGNISLSDSFSNTTFVIDFKLINVKNE